VIQLESGKSVFQLSQISVLGEKSPHRRPRKKSDERLLMSARLQKLLQRLVPHLASFFPGAKLTV
jgi:hypothetical protein